jgi:SAM-dependent methyltransferase
MLKSFLKKEMFFPSFPLGLFLNAFYFPRKGINRFVKKNAAQLHGRILDVGCGSKPYKSFFQCDEYIGIDIENPGHSHKEEQIDKYYDGKHIPYENNSFDNLVCFEVLEHVFEPDLFLSELNRVIRPGGQALLTTPFIWNEHEVPYDFGRYSSYGLTFMLKKHGFEIVKYDKILNGPEFICALVNVFIVDYSAFFNKKVSRLGVLGLPFKVLNYLVSHILYLWFNILGLIFTIFPRNKKFYFNNGVLLKKS